MFLHAHGDAAAGGATAAAPPMLFSDAFMQPFGQQIRTSPIAAQQQQQQPQQPFRAGVGAQPAAIASMHAYGTGGQQQHQPQQHQPQWGQPTSQAQQSNQQSQRYPPAASAPSQPSHSHAWQPQQPQQQPQLQQASVTLTQQPRPTPPTATAAPQQPHAVAPPAQAPQRSLPTQQTQQSGGQHHHLAQPAPSRAPGAPTAPLQASHGQLAQAPAATAATTQLSATTAQAQAAQRPASQFQAQQPQASHAPTAARAAVPQPSAPGGLANAQQALPPQQAQYQQRPPVHAFSPHAAAQPVHARHVTPPAASTSQSPHAAAHGSHAVQNSNGQTQAQQQPPVQHSQQWQQQPQAQRQPVAAAQSQQHGNPSSFPPSQSHSLQSTVGGPQPPAKAMPSSSYAQLATHAAGLTPTSSSSAALAPSFAPAPSPRQPSPHGAAPAASSISASPVAAATPSAASHAAPARPQINGTPTTSVAALPAPHNHGASLAPSHSATSAPAAASAPVPTPAPVARTSVGEARKQELLGKAHALYEQQQQHSRGMRAQVQELREQLVRVHQQAQQAAIGQLLPVAPSFAADADVSPLTASMADSSDPALLALLDNSKTLESKLCEKQTLVEQMRLVVERVETFVREQVEKETRRNEEERARMEWQHNSASGSGSRRSGVRRARIGVDQDDASVASVALPDLASTLTSPLVASLTTHIGALQQQNSLTQTLLLLKNKSLAQQQEQHSMLVETLRAQISGLTLRAERREKENLEERAMLTDGLKTMLDALATENEQLKKAAAASAVQQQQQQQQSHSPYAQNGFGSHSLPNGVPAAQQPNGFPPRFPTPPQISATTPSSTVSSNPSGLPAPPRAAGSNPGPLPPTHFAPMSLPSFPAPPAATAPAGSFSAAGAMPFSPSRIGLQQAPFGSAAPMPSGGLHAPMPAPAMHGARSPHGLDAATHALLSASPFQARPSFLPPLNTTT